MIWHAEWWGMIFIAEHKEEAEALISFYELLPDEPNTHYDGGDKKLYVDEEVRAWKFDLGGVRREHKRMKLRWSLPTYFTAVLELAR